MHPDLPKLLDVHGKDRQLTELLAQLDEISTERDALDAALESARGMISQTESQVSDSASRRDEREGKVQELKTLQDRRRQRLEQERSPRVAAQLMADLEMARGVLAQEESEWLRLAEDASQREAAVTSAREQLQTLEEEQAELRVDLESRLKEAEGACEAARAERDTAAEGLDSVIRLKYTRLRGARTTAVLVPANGGTCTACYTAIPTSRLGQLQADCLLVEGCEMCGAILYVEEVTA